MNRARVRLTPRSYYYDCDACHRPHPYSGSQPAARIHVGQVVYTACPKGARELESAFGRAATSFQLRLPGLAPAPRFPREDAP